MQPAFWLLIVLACPCGAQSRHFDDEQPPGSRLARDLLAGHNLAGHNKVRSRVGVAPLAWSDKLAGKAQQVTSQTSFG